MALSEEARQLKNQRAREWRRKNPEKEREYHERYWEKKAREAATEKEDKHE